MQTLRVLILSFFYLELCYVNPALQKLNNLPSIVGWQPLRSFKKSFSQKFCHLWGKGYFAAVGIYQTKSLGEIHLVMLVNYRQGLHSYRWLDNFLINASNKADIISNNNSASTRGSLCHLPLRLTCLPIDFLTSYIICIRNDDRFNKSYY